MEHLGFKETILSNKAFYDKIMEKSLYFLIDQLQVLTEMQLRGGPANPAASGILDMQSLLAAGAGTAAVHQ